MIFFVKMLFWGVGGVGVLSLIIASIVSAMKPNSGGGASSFLIMVFMIVVVGPLYIYIMPEDPDAAKPKVYAAKVEVDPLLEARRERAREIDRENKRMEEYADREHRELSARSTRVAVNPSSVNGMAEYRYYLKSGKIVSCLRGFDGEVLVFNCTNYSFDR